MKIPPTPLTASGLAERCTNVVGTTLVLQCHNGWGWSQQMSGTCKPFEDQVICSGQLTILVQGFVHFTTPRSGVHGLVTHAPHPYTLERFVAFIMSDGCEYDFTTNIAIWRVMLGDGDLDYDSEWFPVLKGRHVFFGYGSIGLDAHCLSLSQSGQYETANTTLYATSQERRA